MKNKGHSIIGIRIANSDARRNFPPGVTKAIDIELDDLRIRCDLKASFWQDRPEICDPRVCAWLEAKFLGQKLPPFPIPIEMVKRGNVYQLHLLPRQQKTPKGGFGLTV